MDEIDLAKRAIQGDEQAQLQLLTLYQDTMYRVAFSYLHNEVSKKWTLDFLILVNKSVVKLVAKIINSNALLPTLLLIRVQYSIKKQDAIS